MKKATLFILALSIISIGVYGQNHKCGTMKQHEKLKLKDAKTELRMQELEQKTERLLQSRKDLRGASVVTIPVVVHVVYHTSNENVSDAQINSQIDVLNADFRLLNTDSLDDTHPFWVYTADTKIEFVLATVDPNGNVTTGITRTYTTLDGFSGEDEIEKFSSAGGKDNWDATQYLNLWVCNLDYSGGTLGYASFPSDLGTYPDYDGVVIDFRAFGTMGTAGTDGFDENNLGRTATHEVGHWLNLYHIWGDETCGDDLVDDTPTQEQDNAGCPSFPYNANSYCGSDGNGEMFMNYMDYVDDACMVMFTFGQSDRMNAALTAGRSGILSSNGTAINKVENVGIGANIYPNPTDGSFYVDMHLTENTVVEVEVMNILGEIVYSYTHARTNSLHNFMIDLNSEPNGIYFVSIIANKQMVNKKIILN